MRNVPLVNLLLRRCWPTVSQACIQKLSGNTNSAEDGNVLPGASVTVKRTTNATLTDAESLYQLNVPTGATVVFSAVSRQAIEELVNGRNVLDVTMKNDVKQLSKVIVTALAPKEEHDKFASPVSTVPEITLPARAKPAC